VPNRALDKHDKRGLKSSELFPSFLLYPPPHSVMAPNKPDGGNDRGDPQTAGESSSSSTVSPIVMNGMNEIVNKLSEM